MPVENLDYSKEDNIKICFDTEQEFDDYATKIRLIAEAQASRQIKNYDFVRLINETFTPKEILFAATCHYMHIFRELS